jgi:UDP-N-acetylglucosamine:LPS N-acetylglucosamine transferase
VLAVASGGGHWVQLRRLVSVLDCEDIAYVTTFSGYREEVGGARFHVVTDGNRQTKWRLLRTSLQILWIIIRERPAFVISTGAAPGYIAVRLAKLLGARTAWIDSIANVEQLSLSGQMVGAHADLWLTQWSHLARPDGPQFRGSVL